MFENWHYLQHYLVILVKKEKDKLRFIENLLTQVNFKNYKSDHAESLVLYMD